MTAAGTRFPVAIIHYSAPPAPGEAGRVASAHAAALARAGYPVRLVVGTGAAPSPGVDLRLAPELAPAHPRTLAVNGALLRGETPEGFEALMLDLAQAIGRELVGCGTVFVHEFLTAPWNLAATDALWRLEKGSRRPGIPGSPTRRWVVWASDFDARQLPSGPEPKRRPWSLLRERLPGARFVAPSEARRREVAKGLAIPQKQIEVVPGGVDVAGFLGLSEDLRALAEEMRLFAADAVLFTPAVAGTGDGLDLGLGIVKAMSRARRRLEVRWLVTGAPDPRDAASSGRLQELLSKRDALGLRDSVRFLAAECDWARDGIPGPELAALHRLADAVLLPGTRAASGLAALEAALARNLLVIGPSPALRDLVKGEKALVLLEPRERPAAAAKRILAGLASLPAAGLARRVRRELSWDVVARDCLVPLVEGGKLAARSRKR